MQQVCEVLQLKDYMGTLLKWSLQPPSSDAIEKCSDVLRHLSMKRWEDKNSSEMSNISSATIKSYGIKEKEWVLLGRCKRLWGAQIMYNLLNGVPVGSVAKSFQSTINAIESLQSSVKLFSGRMQKFCAEIGSVLLERIIKNFKENLDFHVPKELKSLFTVPLMNKKIARILFDALNISNVRELAEASAEKIAHQFHLSMDFHLQVGLI